jgi:hypothetical protein
MTSTEPMKPMKAIGHHILQSLVACTVVCALASPLHAWEPNAKDLDAAVGSGEFSGYFGKLTGWLSQKAPTDPSKITQVAMETLLKDPVVSIALAQRQFIGKVGPDKLAAFAKMDAESKPFLSWLLKNPKALDLYLLAATPLSIPVREDNSYQLSTDVLDRWKKIFAADTESKDGMPLRIAIATALRPPGTGSPGSGQQKVHSPPFQRYTYFKKAHANNELFPSFNNLSVWELQFVVCSGASEADLTWGREMIKNWRPDYLNGEKVVDTTSCVWRRNSPVSHVDYKTVLDGGGKCGPRSSWSVFICQAFGIPAIGVGQPAHACVAYKSLTGWQVAYGRGWDASRLEGMGGREFVASVESRERKEVFSMVEHLRWLASTLPAKEPRSMAVLAVGQALAKSLPGSNRDLTASEKADEMDADSGALATVKPVTAKPTAPAPPVKVAPGVMHIEGTEFFETGGITVWGGEPRVTVLDSYNGGKQLHFQQGMASSWVGYKINVPETGVYEMTLKVAAVNSGQSLYIRSFGAMLPVKQATASNVWRGDTKGLGPQLAVDHNPSTRWAVNGGVDNASIELDLGKPSRISTIMIDERAYEKVSKFILEYKAGSEWKTILEGTTIGSSYVKDFPAVTTQNVRLTTLDCSGNVGGPTFWEISVGTVQDGHAWVPVPWTAGLWTTTKPADIRLVKGAQTIWIFAPYQRGVAFKSFELKPKGK